MLILQNYNPFWPESSATSAMPSPQTYALNDPAKAAHSACIQHLTMLVIKISIYQSHALYNKHSANLLVQ